jgi:hypothetical protein
VAEDDDLSSDPRVHFHSLLLLRRPATGVSGHESLSDSEESRFSPVRAPPTLGELSSDDCTDGLDCSDGEDGDAEDEGIDSDAADPFDSVEDVVSMLEMVSSELMEDSMSKCAMVYLVVLISSSRGVLHETLFSAGKKRRAGAILRGRRCFAGLLLRIEVRLWGCL